MSRAITGCPKKVPILGHPPTGWYERAIERIIQRQAEARARSWRAMVDAGVFEANDRASYRAFRAGFDCGFRHPEADPTEWPKQEDDR